jgi:Glycosyl hydrolase family 10
MSRSRFKAARAADPEAKLYVNHYNVERDGSKMRALYDLIASPKREGAPIDGIGLQSHFVTASAPRDIQSVMEKFAGLGIDVALTELDLRICLPADDRALAAQAADNYASISPACRSIASACAQATLISPSRSSPSNASRFILTVNKKPIRGSNPQNTLEKGG